VWFPYEGDKEWIFMPKVWEYDSYECWNAVEESEENRAFQFGLRSQ